MINIHGLIKSSKGYTFQNHLLDWVSATLSQSAESWHFVCCLRTVYHFFLMVLLIRVWIGIRRVSPVGCESLMWGFQRKLKWKSLLICARITAQWDTVLKFWCGCHLEANSGCGCLCSEVSSVHIIRQCTSFWWVMVEQYPVYVVIVHQTTNEEAQPLWEECGLSDC